VDGHIACAPSPTVRGTYLNGTPARIKSVGTAVPVSSYTQEEVLDALDVKDRRLRSVFLNGGIERRHLCLPPMRGNELRDENQETLLRKHTLEGIKIGRQAIETCLDRAGASPADVRYLCCVSSTGLIIPGFSALLIKEMGLPTSCSRLDIVGMGCNAGLNALAAVSGWASQHPDELAIMVCIEVCSAMYVTEPSMRTAVVNSLFGDGAAAISIIANSERGTSEPKLLRFASCLIPEAIDAMRLEWKADHGKFSFGLDAEVPYVVGAHAEKVLSELLTDAQVKRSDIAHWIVHSGGKKVIDSIRVNLGLSRGDMRHTISVLRDHGNLSSGSFLFSYDRLIRETQISHGDYAVLMTMGPGSTIETALVQW